MQHSRLISIVLLVIACGGFMGSLLWAISILCEFGVVYFYYQARAEIVFFLLGILFWGLSCFYVGMKFFLQPHKAIDEGIIPTVKMWSYAVIKNTAESFMWFLRLCYLSFA